MQGVQYITNEKGQKTAIVISLKKNKVNIEDLLLGLEAQSRIKEPSVPFSKSIEKMIRQKRKNATLRDPNKKVR